MFDVPQFFYLIIWYFFQTQNSLNIPNHRGDTPLSLLQSNLGAVWIGPKVTEIIKDTVNNNRSRNVLFRFAKDKVNCS